MQFNLPLTGYSDDVNPVEHALESSTTTGK